MTDLNIDVICANSAAAKGRVERNNARTYRERTLLRSRVEHAVSS